MRIEGSRDRKRRNFLTTQKGIVLRLPVLVGIWSPCHFVSLPLCVCPLFLLFVVEMKGGGISAEWSSTASCNHDPIGLAPCKSRLIHIFVLPPVPCCPVNWSCSILYHAQMEYAEHKPSRPLSPSRDIPCSSTRYCIASRQTKGKVQWLFCSHVC